MLDTLIKDINIVTEKGVVPGSLGISGGKIAALVDPGTQIEAGLVIQGGGQYLLPGGVDPHVHIRYPGVSHRETFYTGTQAAAAGGITTVIEHPISKPPQYSKSTLQVRVDSVREEAIVDVAFYGAAGASHLEEIVPLSREGIVAYKSFLHAAPEGRDLEFEGLTAKDSFELHCVLREVAKTSLLMAAHTEDNDLVAGNIAALRKAGKTKPRDHCLSRPAIVEVLAVQRLLALAKESGARAYLVHISTPEAVEIALKAREEGQEVYVETCPHYLYLTEDALDQFGAYAKCNPALRDAERVEKLWQYAADGTIDTIGSDHAPYTVAEKEKSPEDIFVPPSGFPGLETRLGFMLKAVHEGRISLNRAIDLLSHNPARIFGLSPQKGAIRLGADADLVLLDPFVSYTVNSAEMLTMARDICKFLDGTTLFGRVQKTFVRGKLVYDQGQVLAAPGWGQWVRPLS